MVLFHSAIAEEYYNTTLHRAITSEAADGLRNLVANWPILRMGDNFCHFLFAFAHLTPT